jgi:hypothetical protein
MKTCFSTKQTARCLVFLVALAALPAAAQSVPALINYQGRLVNTNGSAVGTGDYELRFRIWDAPTGGSLVWGPQVFDGRSGPGFGPVVPVVHGWFNVILGPLDTNGVPIAGAFAGTNRFLDIQLGTNAPFSPRQQVLSAPYALQAGLADQARVALTALSARTADAAASLLGTATTGPLTLHVATNGLDGNDGLSWAAPKRTIQAAVDAVPGQIRHRVQIRIGPGEYPEAVEIVEKRVANPGIGSLELIGMGLPANPTVIAGRDGTGERRPYGVAFRRSYGSLYNIVVREGFYGVLVSPDSQFFVGRCRVEDVEIGIACTQFSWGTIEDCSFRNLSRRGRYALGVELGAIVAFRNDHSYPENDNDIAGLPGEAASATVCSAENFSYAINTEFGGVVYGASLMQRINIDQPDNAGRGTAIYP